MASLTNPQQKVPRGQGEIVGVTNCNCLTGSHATGCIDCLGCDRSYGPCDRSYFLVSRWERSCGSALKQVSTLSASRCDRSYGSRNRSYRFGPDVIGRMEGKRLLESGAESGRSRLADFVASQRWSSSPGWRSKAEVARESSRKEKSQERTMGNYFSPPG